MWMGRSARYDSSHCSEISHTVVLKLTPNMWMFSGYSMKYWTVSIGTALLVAERACAGVVPFNTGSPGQAAISPGPLVAVFAQPASEDLKLAYGSFEW